MSDLLYIQNIPVEKLRSQVIELLQENYAHNAIEIEEYERRVGLASAAEDRAELLRVVDGLPILRTSGDASADRGRWTENNRWSDDGRGADYRGPLYQGAEGREMDDSLGIREEENLVAVFSGVGRKGRWHPARSSKLLALFGGLELDFRKAVMPPGKSYVEALCLFGGAEITVPDDINVEVEGIPIFGGIENKSSGGYIPGAPTLRIRAFVMFGGLEIKAKRR